MEILKIFLLIGILLAYPLLPGSFFDWVFLEKQKKGSRTAAYLSGSLMCGVLFGVLTFLGKRAGWEFAYFRKIFLAVYVCLLFFCVIMLLFSGYRFYLKDMFGGVFAKKNKSGLLWVLAYGMIALLYMFYPFYISDTFSVPEQVMSLVRTGGVLGGTENPACFYACLSELFSLSPYAVLFRVIPYVVLFHVFCVIREMGELFFGDDRKARILFLFAYVLLIIFGNDAHMNPPYGLLHFPYEGLSIISNVWIPYAIVVVLRRRNIVYPILLLINACLLDAAQKGSVVLAVQICVLGAWLLFSFLCERRSRK